VLLEIKTQYLDFKEFVQERLMSDLHRNIQISKEKIKCFVRHISLYLGKATQFFTRSN